jgi:hypothetical protein
VFHLNDNSQQKKTDENGFDALFKVRPLLQKLTDKFQQTYYPEEAVTVDKGMCPFRGRADIRVYMPQKSNKYGMKLFIPAESRTGYIWNFEVYRGKDPELDNGAAGIVKRLLDKLTNKGHTVYVDRFYTSVPLVEELAKANTGLIGTVMKSRKGLPEALKEAKIKKGEQVFCQKKNVLALRWRDKRDVWTLSSRHTAQITKTSNRQGKEKMKPLAVADCNKHKAGVDLFDKPSVPCRRFTAC